MNREAWLTKATAHLTKTTLKTFDVPEVRVSVGWPSRGATSQKNRTIGQCWYGSATGDEIPQIFISPVLHEPVQILETLVHELLHAALPEGTKHGSPFAKAMAVVGLIGKPTATAAGEELRLNLAALADKLGDFDHAKINLGIQLPKQTTRLLKVECPQCGYIARVTARWLDEAGPPVCPADEVPFEEAS